jgi:hypothetical protein
MEGKRACFTLDLEPDFLSMDSHEILLNDERFARIEEFFLRNQLKLTTFVVGKMLTHTLPVREKFSAIETEFELHSYSHDTDETDSEREIVLAKKAYTDYFGRQPRGYRAPNGDISADGLANLHREGFEYSANIFPTWRPELGYNYFGLPTSPWTYKEFPNLLELPFAVVPGVRVVISLSFLKLFGLAFYHFLFNTFGLPDILVIDSHLYDFFATSPVLQLSRRDWRRYALLRNQQRVFEILQMLVDLLKERGYSFVFMGELSDELMASRESLPMISSQKLNGGRSSEQHLRGESAHNNGDGGSRAQ